MIDPNTIDVRLGLITILAMINNSTIQLAKFKNLIVSSTGLLTTLAMINNLTVQLVKFKNLIDSNNR